MTQLTRQCRGPCGRTLVLAESNFGKDATQRGGWKTMCKLCVRQDSKNRRLKAKNHAFQQANVVVQRIPGDGLDTVKWPSVEAYDKAEAAGEEWEIILPLNPVPDGFDVRAVSTQVDAEGNTEKQWIDSGPEQENAELVSPLPLGHRLRGVSTLVSGDGKIRVQWQKTDLEKEQKLNIVEDAIRHIADQWPSRAIPVLEPTAPLDSDLLCVYPMGDPHFGMYAWAAETGDDYDLELASQYHATAMDQLVKSAPSAEECLIINLGDFFHMDDSSNETKRSGHKLDVDTRWPKVVRHGLQSMVWLVRRSLEKHKRTRVWNVPGNHDDHSAVALQLALEAYFRDEPRVYVDPNPAAHYFYHFGRNLIGATHGHTSKLNPLGEIMAADRKVEWGASDHYYWYVGHVHHDSMLETRGGVVIETMRTLAARDKYAADAGYRAGRDMKCDVLHRLDGRVHRNTIGIRQIKRCIREKIGGL